jgi:outer membrane protein assembly factor BamB
MKNIYLSCFLFYAILSSCSNPGKKAMFHADEKHSGVYEANGNSVDTLQWKFKTGGKIFSSPVVYGGVVFIGSEDKNLYALDAAGGAVKWKFATGGAVHSTPTIYNNAVYFGSFDGYYYSVNAATGALNWKCKTKGEKVNGRVSLWTMKPVNEYMDDPFDFFLSSPVVHDGVVYFGSSDGNLYAIDANTGKQKWQLQTGGIIHSSPAFNDNTIYVGSWDTYMYAADVATGAIKWKFKTGSDTAYHLLEGIQASPLLYDGLLYFGARDGYFYALNAATGALAWKYSANSSWILTTAAAKDGVVYTGTSDTYLLLALNAKTGKEVFKIKANGYVYSSPAIAGGTVYFGDFTGKLYAVDCKTGAATGAFFTDGRKQYAAMVLKDDKIDFLHAADSADLSLYSSTVKGMNNLYKLGPIVSSPCVSDDIIYFGSADGYVYALKLKEERGK